MNRENAKQEIRREWRRIIPNITSPAAQKANGETSWICPLCGHGSNGDGMTANPRSADGNSLKCFGCNFSGDIIDLYQQTTGKDYNTALSLLAQEIGIEIDTFKPKAANDFKPVAHEAQPAATRKDNVQQEKPAAANYMQYYLKCINNLDNPAADAYLRGRGIDPFTASKYMIGFDPAADPAQKGYYSPRIIIPTSETHYFARSIDPATEKKYQKMNNKGGTPGIFNLDALYAQDVQTVFVTEGAFNALSFIEAGAAAIATNSASNADLLLKALEKRPTAATLILAFDNDKAGRTATDRMKAGLQRLNISYILAGKDVIGTGDQTDRKEDANDLLIKNRAAFIEAVQETQRKTAARPDNISYYIDNLMTGDIDRFKSEIKTGFADLDKKAGGIYSGLYVLAAISSLGKTTFAAQMCDQIAAAGHDVLFFSMEQSRLELVSKSIARKTFINNRETAVSSLSIRKGYLPQQVRAAAAQYQQEVQERISVIEGNFNCDISFIGEYVRQYVRRNNARPVIMVDYLQVLQPGQQNGRQQTVKETIDTSITELKRISREMELPIFVISSVNRANYLTPIDFESLKESGSIEYTADVIWGLQLQCLNDPIFDKQNNIKERREKVKEAKAATPRKIELVCLKNRYGIANFSAYFNYYPANDYFEESSSADTDFNQTASVNKTRKRL